MSEGLDEEQLLEFCHRLGLAKDGFLDEKELVIVCNCIGLQAPEPVMKELFEELDGDHDGKVLLTELSQMLRGMQQTNKMPTSPEKIKKSQRDLAGGATSSSMVDSTSVGFGPIPSAERGAFSILDPQNTGFTKVGSLLDLWSQLGINTDSGVRILNELGFTSNSRSHSINLQDLSKSLEEETDHSLEGLSPLFRAALVTYRTESQYLRSICDGIECERDKLKSDIYEAHQRSAMLAQEVDEQNARLERNSQMLFQKMEMKYNEQVHDLQQRFASEKESLQQALQMAESQLKALRDEDARLKLQISQLKSENSALEKEVQGLNQDIRNVNRAKAHLEKELTRYAEIENRLQEMERRSVDTLTSNDGKLHKAYNDMQQLRDKNDELTVQLEKMRENLKMVKVSREKRNCVKKRKNTSQTPPSMMLTDDDGLEEPSGFPLEKKFNRGFQMNLFQASEEHEECESSIDPCIVSSSCSQPDSGNFPTTSKMSLDACMGESSTDTVNDSPLFDELNRSHCDCDSSKSIRLDNQYKTVESEMDAVKEKIVTIIAEKELLISENADLKKELCEVQRKKSSSSSTDQFVQTDELPVSTIMDTECTSSSDNNDLIVQLQTKIKALEKEVEDNSSEKKKLKDRVTELEGSIDLLRDEYEKCEDYWQGKLQEERVEYEQDRLLSDDKFNELAMKIKEYEEMFLAQESNKLPPIEERASLERQFTELEDECEGLRRELMSVRMEQELAISTYQKTWEAKMIEDSNQLEQQVSMLTKKCQEYESRLSSLAVEEGTTLEASAMADVLQERVQTLENQLREQEFKHTEQVEQVERTWRDKELQWIRSKSLEAQKFGNAAPNALVTAVWKEEMDSPTRSRSYVDMPPVADASKAVEALWPQRMANAVDKSASLPFISAVESPMYYNNGWGTVPTMFQPDIWSAPPVSPSKKAWCHVELGWLQGIRAKLKQRDEQCFMFQRSLQQKELETNNIISDMKYQHEAEVNNWESLMHASQELVRQQAIKHKEQAEKLAHADRIMKDIWMENAKLVATLNASEQRAMHLDNLLKFQMSNANVQHQHPSFNAGPPSMPGRSNHNGGPQPPQHSLPLPMSHQHFST